MAEKKRYLLCPQCGSRRMFVVDVGGKEHFFYVLQDHTLEYATTGLPLPEDLEVTRFRCADCSWKGNVRKLTPYVV